jgi:hypothetical protein
VADACGGGLKLPETAPPSKTYHPGEQVANTRATPDQRRHHECGESRAGQGGEIRRPTDALFDHVASGHERKRPPHETAYANTTKDASGQRLITPVTG